MFQGDVEHPHVALGRIAPNAVGCEADVGHGAGIAWVRPLAALQKARVPVTKCGFHILSRTHDLSESSVEVRQVGAAGAGGWVGLKYLSSCHAYNQ